MVLHYVFFFVFLHSTVSLSSISEYSLKYLIQENEPIGRMVGIIGTDIEGNGFASRRYQFVTFKLGVDSPWFSVDPKTGEMKISVLLDLEEVCRSNNSNIVCTSSLGVVNIIVNVWNFGHLLAVVRVKISVLDINDNPPKFPSSKIERYVNEASHKKGQIIFLDAATDADISPDNRVIDYGLAEHSIIFQLQTDAIGDPQLILLQDLDAEKEVHHSLRMQAWNPQKPNHKAELIVDIIVADFNDNPPKFNSSKYSVMVKESTIPGTIIYQMIAEDRDSTSVLRYSIDRSAKKMLQNYFFIFSNGSVVTGKERLNYEQKNSFQIPVFVSDEIFTARTILEVFIQDENDEKPEIMQNPETIEVLENSDAGLVIGQVTVSDKDEQHTNGRIICQYKSKNSELSLIPSTKKESKDLMFDIRTEKSFDREKSATVNAVMICSDGWNSTSSVSHTSTFTIRVHIIDANDNSPVFEKSLYFATVHENSPYGTQIIKVTANDADAEQNAKVVYSLTNESHLFQLDGKTGSLTVKGMLDREKNDYYRLHITASDEGSPPRNGSTIVQITVQDENDHIPQLLQPTEFTIDENEPARVIGQLKYEDHDIGRNAAVFFSTVWSEDDVMSVTANGTLSITRPLDREVKERYCLRVKLQDMGIPESRQSNGEICVRVLDVNDNAPEFLEPPGLMRDDANFSSGNVHPITVSIYEPPGQIVTKIVATDRDRGRNGKLTYDAEYPPNFPADAFTVNTTDGFLLLNSRIPASYIGIYKVRITVTDGGSPALTSKKYIFIQIADISPKDEPQNPTDPTSPWTERNNMFAVLILTTISACLIIMFVIAIACMLKPCPFRNNNSNADWNADSTTNRTQSLKNAEFGGYSFGSLQENMIINGGSDVSTSLLMKSADQGHVVGTFSNFDTISNVEDWYYNYKTLDLPPICIDDKQATLKHRLFQPCSMIPRCQRLPFDITESDVMRDEEVKCELHSDSGKGASDEDAVRAISTFSSRTDDSSRFLNCHPMMMKSFPTKPVVVSSDKTLYQDPQEVHGEMICDEINKLFFQDMI